LLSVPMTMVVKIALESSPSTHWIGILLDSERALSSSRKTPPQEPPSSPDHTESEEPSPASTRL